MPVKFVELSNYGEAFLNPSLPEILAEGYKRRVALAVGNGANLNNVRPETLEALVDYRLTAILCSIDGASDETYRQYRVRGKFERVIENIRVINRWKAELRSPLPKLTWQFIIFGHNEHEIGKARCMAAELGMQFKAKLNWDPDFSPIRDADLARCESGVNAATRKEFKEMTGTDMMEGLCTYLWNRPQINWDGKNLGCPRNFWGDFGGNAFTDGLEACLNSEKATYARQMLMGRRPSRPDIPCHTCEIYHARKAKGR